MYYPSISTEPIESPTHRPSATHSSEIVFKIDIFTLYLLSSNQQMNACIRNRRSNN